MALAKDLTQEKLLDAAFTILREGGLGGLSMRQLATALAVAPGALYWHVKSKQELLALLADRILTLPAAPEDGGAPDRLRAQAIEVRTALLSVRDGAEVVSFAQALRPRELAPLRLFHDTLAAALPEPQAEWAARTLTHYVLGAVAEEQNYAELARAGILTEEDHHDYSTETFLFGVDAILTGLLAAQP